MKNETGARRTYTPLTVEDIRAILERAAENAGPWSAQGARWNVRDAVGD